MTVLKTSERQQELEPGFEHQLRFSVIGNVAGAEKSFISV